MSRDGLIRQLEDAANNIADAPREDIQILLRRAALALRNIGMGLDLVRENAQQLVDEMAPDPDGPGAA